MSFKTFGFNPRIMAGIEAAGFTTPTPVQTQTIPSILEGRDVMGLAQTGTGKTAAFVLPILQRIMDEPRGRARVLVITPTRELAEQIHGAIRDLGRKTRVRSMTVYGGAGMVGQIKKLKAGVEIIVACPGRLLDHLRQGNVNLSGVEILVLDEADRMLDMGFMPDVKSILKALTGRKQSLLFSATMPEDIRRLTKQIMKDPAVVQIDHSRPAKTVSHALYPVEPHLKTPLLLDMLKSIDDSSVLIFTRTRIRTERLARQLKGAGFSVAALQGSMPQGRRQAALNGFREGKYKILVATDVAARGVDVLGISHVINYDMPDTSDAYTHRVGRTGRAEMSGKAFTLVTQEDASAVRAFEREMCVELVCCELEGFDYNVPAPPRGSAFPGRRGGNGSGGHHHPRPRKANGAKGPGRHREGSNGGNGSGRSGKGPSHGRKRHGRKGHGRESQVQP